MSIGVAIVGLGWISEKIHLPFFTNNNLINFIGVFDVNFDRAKEVKEKFKIDQIFNSYESLLESSKIDIVVIATPNHLHFTQIKKAILIDKIVFCEKPICINEEEVEDLRKLGLKLGNLFPLLPSRFKQEIQETKRILTDIGKIYKVRGSWSRGNGIPNSEWFTNKYSSGGGVLIDLGSHILDVVFYLLDFPDILTEDAFLSNNFINQNENISNWHGNRNFHNTAESIPSVEDNAQLFLKSNHMSINIDLSWAGVQTFDETKFEIHGTKGSLMINTLFGFSQNRRLTESTVVYLTKNKKEVVIRLENDNPTNYYYNMLATNLDKVKNQKSNLAFVSNALNTMDVINRVYKKHGMLLEESKY